MKLKPRTYFALSALITAGCANSTLQSASSLTQREKKASENADRQASEVQPANGAFTLAKNIVLSWEQLKQGQAPLQERETEGFTTLITPESIGLHSPNRTLSTKGVLDLAQWKSPASESAQGLQTYPVGDNLYWTQEEQALLLVKGPGNDKPFRTAMESESVLDAGKAPLFASPSQILGWSSGKLQLIFRHEKSRRLVTTPWQTDTNKKPLKAVFSDEKGNLWAVYESEIHHHSVTEDGNRLKIQKAPYSLSTTPELAEAPKAAFWGGRGSYDSSSGTFRVVAAIGWNADSVLFRLNPKDVATERTESVPPASEEPVSSEGQQAEPAPAAESDTPAPQP